ncbi:hypothetical protein MMC14_005068 [Varicellaria rhodocarpa]|nr:hypothetical protein [Varicellaria rhodocarpa]
MSTVGQEGQDQHIVLSREDPKPTFDSYSDLSSTAPNSQASSLGDSSNSQASRSQISSKSTSRGQAAIEENPHKQLKKSISPSREEAQIQSASTCSLYRSIPALSQKRQDANTQPKSASLKGTYVGGIQDEKIQAHGQKRTASGNVKVPGLTSPISPYRKSHSRHTSTASTGSQVGELSAQLRTRLSYAMVKVQNGWESRTIDEVETLASQQTSPVSALSSSQRSYEAPYVDMMDLYRERSGFQQSSERTTAASSQPLTATHLPSNSLGQSSGYQYSSKPTYPISGHSDGSIQKHHTRKSSKQTLTPQSHTGAQAPSLAPPLELGSRHFRRPVQGRVQPPPPDTHSLSNLSTSSSRSASSAVPATPPPKRTPVTKTTSQKDAAIEKAAMEKDAIETLIFMSSPGNSQYHLTNSQLPSTPLRNHFLAAQKRVDFVIDESVASSPQRQRALLDTMHLSNEASIDKLLDQMSDRESSSDDEMLVSPRHGVPG